MPPRFQPERNHEMIQVKSPALELLICRRDVLPDWQVDIPQTPYWRLYRPYNAMGCLRFGGEEWVMQPGEVWLIAPETTFSARPLGPLEKFYLHFVVGGELASCTDFACRLPPSAALSALIEQAGEKLLRRALDFRLEHEAAAIALTALALLPDSFRVRHAPVDSRLMAVWQLLQRKSARPYSNRELAGVAKMGLSTFIRSFYTHFGLSPQQFVQEQRVRRAAHLLVTTNLPVARIAEQCGFCDIYYFSRVFRRLRGTPPTEYRKRHYAPS